MTGQDKILSEQENIILQMLSVTFAGRKGKTCQTEKQTKTSQLMDFFYPLLGSVFDLKAVSRLL